MPTVKLIPITPPESVQLDLTMEEAQVVYSALGRIGGHSSGPRGIVDRVYLALGAAGIANLPDATWDGWLGLKEKFNVRQTG